MTSETSSFWRSRWNRRSNKRPAVTSDMINSESGKAQCTTAAMSLYVCCHQTSLNIIACHQRQGMTHSELKLPVLTVV